MNSRYNSCQYDIEIMSESWLNITIMVVLRGMEIKKIGKQQEKLWKGKIASIWQLYLGCRRSFKDPRPL